jgi:hypothetical protein
MHNANVLSSAYLSSIWKILQLHADMKGSDNKKICAKNKKNNGIKAWLQHTWYWKRKAFYLYWIAWTLVVNMLNNSSSASVQMIAVWFMMTHKYRGCIVVLLINKSVEPNEEQKVLTSGFDQGFTVNTSKRVFRGIW